MKMHYIWARTGADPGTMYIVPDDHMDAAWRTLRDISKQDPEFRWIMYDLEAAYRVVKHAQRHGGGDWAYPGHSTHILGGLAESYDASRWLWEEGAARDAALV
jgi:hypothetical protein